ncbi:3-alpha,7-alpha,12-alpha-trihydroxy-5-beta-cholest-24-enoyl-CoA hydratase [Verticiella sediminum]|uniref:3-alpha,7-alpha, 12-alpha-trihydroxy-5-beta-cholest-24-enoyl-CoA hydratase n=1 Tax=Verticiella sediminum TaxID=1247510 RepID=A0A556AJJ6_9BURK|nr:MaoC/PaaZ C-terminal domain-containing protein [Verticiella sediminum]TSH93049.1 3-alpha,7-alpha,12-alpha-trihydroxy-5-beta-cholest-24-enoyl-CoA hydratase [Verticiella sediminum]
MIDYEKTKAWRSGPVRHAYTEKDTMLYALGLGVGSDPMDARQLGYVYEKGLKALPTMAAVLASPGAWMRERSELGIDFLRLVHGEQSLVTHAPLPARAVVLGQSRVTRIVDKGEGKGAILHVEKTLTDEAHGRLLATVEQVLFLRGDGGFSKGAGADEPAARAPALPERAPDSVSELPIRPEAALIYRLSGDTNPLHADPAVAQRAGFARPILHGLCTWGRAAHAVIERACGDDPARLSAFRARLSAPVYPGETLLLSLWHEDDGRIAFQARVRERDVIVLDQGWAHVAGIAPGS